MWGFFGFFLLKHIIQVLIQEENYKGLLEMALKNGHKTQKRMSKNGYCRIKENLEDINLENLPCEERLEKVESVQFHEEVVKRCDY